MRGALNLCYWAFKGMSVGSLEYLQLCQLLSKTSLHRIALLTRPEQHMREGKRALGRLADFLKGKNALR